MNSDIQNWFDEVFSVIGDYEIFDFKKFSNRQLKSFYFFFKDLALNDFSEAMEIMCRKEDLETTKDKWRYLCGILHNKRDNECL